MFKHWIILTMVVLTSPAFGFSCFFTFVKNNCWENYDVSTTVIDANSGKEILQVTIPEGKLWARKAFDCQAGQALVYTATFSPIFWASDKNKIFNSAQRTKLPDTINPTETAWNITVCYPDQYESVPMPPDSNGKCKCDLKSIPPVAPQA